jgi:hypothetical protein
MIEKTTNNRNYPKPDINNTLQDDVSNIENALEMIDSDIHSLKTKIESGPQAPVLTSSNINTNSFTLNWTSEIGATFYCLDISTEETFSSFVADYNNKKRITTNITITGLSVQTTYYCRVRSATNLVSSANSNVVIASTTGTPVAMSETFNYTGSKVNWTVPADVSQITIKAWGAQGGGDSHGTPGKGAYMQGDFNVIPGDTIQIAVGELGATGGQGGGGGGGTFVAKNNSPLIVAGGGGGAHYNNATNGLDGVTSETCSPNASTGTGYKSGSGGGFYSDGAGGDYSSGGGKSWTNNLTGGVMCTGGGSHWSLARGGYGGGGGGAWAPGSGGGYNGGVSPDSGGSQTPGGTAGGSYNSGTNQVNNAGIQLGNGKVIITWTELQ